MGNTKTFDFEIDVSDFLNKTKVNDHEFKKYETMILNQVNQVARGTVPSRVGQMSELLPQFLYENPNGTVFDWKQYHIDHQANAFKNAREIIEIMFNNFKKTVNGITPETIDAWIEDLLYTKTFIGLKLQDEIFRSILSNFKLDYKRSNPSGEKVGIDGFLNEKPFSVKPDSYSSKTNTKQEVIDCPIIKYTKASDGRLLKLVFPKELREMIK